MMTVIEHARRMARRGFPVFPCLQDKKPAVSWGSAATTDVEQIEAWNWEDRLIGVPTGSRSGMAVLDIDPRHGGDDWLRAHARRLVARSHLTRSGGIHLLFEFDGEVRNSAGLIAPGVDVRGEGGYVIWWPAHGCTVLDFLPLSELPPWPGWLTPQRQCGAFDNGRRGRVIADPFQVSVLANFVRESMRGERNNRLFWAACRLAELRFVDPGQQHEAAQKLLNAASAAGLGSGEAARTIESGLSAQGWPSPCQTTTSPN